MSEQATRTPDRTIGEKPLSYFKAVDALDPDAVLAHFADDATLTVQTAHVTFTGAEEIRRMFVDFFAEWESMVHTVTNLVVDVEAGTVATEQHVDLIAGATTAMHNCNFFTVNDAGQFSRVIIWMDGVNPAAPPRRSQNCRAGQQLARPRHHHSPSVSPHRDRLAE